MATISSTLHSYNQLTGLSGNGQAANTVSNLLNTINSPPSQTGTGKDDTVSLSAAAQSLLNGLKTSSNRQTNQNFTLTQAQQAKIRDIVQKYKDAPFTQSTYESILGDMKSAGLSPETMAAKDKATGFSSTRVLLSALGGNFSNAGNQSGVTKADQQAKMTNYMQKVVSYWKSISSSAHSTV